MPGPDLNVEPGMSISCAEDQVQDNPARWLSDRAMDRRTQAAVLIWQYRNQRIGDRAFDERYDAALQAARFVNPETQGGALGFYDGALRAHQTCPKMAKLQGSPEGLLYGTDFPGL